MIPELRVAAENLRYRYRRRGGWALDGLSFEVSASRVAVLGPNGAGKTTLLGILSTAIRPESGTFQVRGVDVTQGHEVQSFRSALGLVPQRLDAMGGLRCRDFLRYVAWLRDVPISLTEERIRESLAAVDLTGSADARMSSLSGGMRQRMALAQALINHPTLVLLDEPTVNLDPAQRDQFLALVRDTSQRATVLMTSHVAEDVASFAEEVVMILDGRAVFVGSLADFCGVSDTERVDGDAVKRAYVDRARHDIAHTR